MSQTIQLGPREIDALARIAVAEAEIDGTRGMQAVVATILNRAAANKGYFGGTNIIDIINIIISLPDVIYFSLANLV